MNISIFKVFLPLLREEFTTAISTYGEQAATVSFSTNVNHSLNVAKALLLHFKNETQTQQDLLSVNVMTYWVPLTVVLGPTGQNVQDLGHVQCVCF